MARIKALTKADKAEQIAALKAAMKTAQGPLADVRAAHKARVAEHKLATKTVTVTAKTLLTASTKLDKFITATELGRAKLQAKIDTVNAAPTISLPKGPKAKAKVEAVKPAAKKAADKVIAKAKGKGKVSTSVAGQPALL